VTVSAAALAVALMCGTPSAARAQVFELQGGGSSLSHGYGGALNVWGDGFEGTLGVGYLDGLRFGGFLKYRLGRDSLRLGNDAIPVRFTTDVFGASHTILAQGAGVRRATKRSVLSAFIGANASATPAPFVNALKHDELMGIVQGERTLSPTLRVRTHALFGKRQTVLQGVHWASPAGMEAGVTAGVGGNQPYGAASFALKREVVELRASYVGMSDHFRRAGVRTPAQSEADRENALVTLRPVDGFSVGFGRQNFRQDSTLPGVPDRATLNQLFGTARFGATNLAAGVFDSRTPGTRNVSSYFTASRDITRWLQTDLYLLRVWAPAWIRSTTPVLRVREFLTPRVSLLQVLTRANGRTSVSFGGALASGLTSVGLDYQVVHTPYRPAEPFVQTIALNVRLPLGRYRVSAASFLSADGQVHYAGSANTFFYAGDPANGARPVEIRFERYIVEGSVVDESGAPVDGAAIMVGTTPVFTDSRGRFFVRLAARRDVAVHLLFDDFLTDAQYEIVSAPSSATPRPERESTPLRIVLRRALSERTRREPPPRSLPTPPAQPNE
jgi:hypothetical protein